MVLDFEDSELPCDGVDFDLLGASVSTNESSNSFVKNSIVLAGLARQEETNVLLGDA